MIQKTLLIGLVSVSALLGQDAPQAKQSTDFKGVVLKGKAPVSNEVLNVKFPKPVEGKLKNGMLLMVLEDHRAPTIQVEIAMPASSLNGSRESAGLSEAATAMLRLGTKTRTSLQIAQTLQELGGTLGANVGETNAFFRISSLTENLDQVLALLADVMFNPSFPQDELDKWKDRQLSQLQQIRAQPAFLGQERFYAVMYPNDNRSIIVPSPESISKITRDMVINYYTTTFRPEGGRVAVSGDISLKDITPKLDKTFAGAWTGAAPKPPSLPMPPPIQSKKIYLINRSSSVQTNIYLGNLAIDRVNPDFIPVTVMNRVLGGGPASRLFRNIREDKGYTYGINSGFSASHYINYFILSTAVRTEVTGPALEEIFKELRDIRDREVPADELGNAKRALVASFALSTEDPAAGLRNATMVKDYGLPADYWDTYASKISMVTAEDVQRVARKYIPVDNAQIVVVGDAPKIREALAKFGPIEDWDSEGHPVKQ